MYSRAILATIVAGIAACASKDGTPPRHPVAGLATTDTAGAWCVMFPADSAHGLAAGDPISLVLAGDSASSSGSAQLGARRASHCWAAFPQPRWHSYVGYDLVDVNVDSPAHAALAIVNGGAWTAAGTAMARSDIDGDGVPEEARRCSADEGEHFTVWTLREGRRRLVWHEYFDWGALVDPTCQPGDDGRDTLAR